MVNVYDIKNLKGAKDKGLINDVMFIPYSHIFGHLDEIYDRETFIDIAPLPLGSLLRFTDFIIRKNPEGRIARTGSTITYQYIEGLYVGQDSETNDTFILADNHGNYLSDEVRKGEIIGNMKVLEPIEKSGNSNDDDEDDENELMERNMEQENPEDDEPDDEEKEPESTESDEPAEEEEEKPTEDELRKRVFEDLNRLEKMGENQQESDEPMQASEPEPKKEESPKKVPVHMQPIPPVHSRENKKQKKFKNKMFDDNGYKKNKKKKWDRNDNTNDLASPGGLFSDPSMNALFDKLTK